MADGHTAEREVSELRSYRSMDPEFEPAGIQENLINKTKCNSDQCDLKDAMKRLMSGGMFLQEVADLDLGGPMPESLF